MPKVTVIGAGVMGLSAALNLQRAGFDTRILTRDRPQATASSAAGAVWSGGGLTGRPRKWAEASLAHFLALTEESRPAESGVGLRRMRQLFPQPVGAPWFQDKLPFFAQLPPAELPPGAQTGWIMQAPVVAPPRYLQRLQEQFLAAGGSMERREIASLDTLDTMDALEDDSRLLVNCTGAWAKYVTPDPEVFPIRGQTLLVDAPHIREGAMRASDDTYLFPRADGLLLGGIYQHGSWRQAVDAEQTRDIFERCAQIEPSVLDAPVRRAAVGIRPGRSCVRLEVEKRASGRAVIHNYGHGSIGFTLSWGSALDALELAKQLTDA